MSIDEMVRQCTDLVKAGLSPFVEYEMIKVYGQGWQTRASCQLIAGTPHWDIQALLKTIIEHWQMVFDKSLPRAARNLVFELKEWRNHVAHEHKMTLEDLSRLLDTAVRLLKIVGASQVTELEVLRFKVLHVVIANSAEVHETVSLSNRELASDHQLVKSRHETRQSHVAGAPPWQACVDRLSDKIGAKLSRKSGRCAFSMNGSYGVCCLVSKEYAGNRFWWNLRDRQLRDLSVVTSAFIAFACGSPDSVILIPLNDFAVWLPTFNPKPGTDGEGWHIHIQHDSGNWWLLEGLE